MDTSSVGHFAALSFIVAPAMLTNASALMGLTRVFHAGHEISAQGADTA
jgi:hypothetical protein